MEVFKQMRSVLTKLCCRVRTGSDSDWVLLLIGY